MFHFWKRVFYASVFAFGRYVNVHIVECRLYTSEVDSLQYRLSAVMTTQVVSSSFSFHLLLLLLFIMSSHMRNILN